MAPASLITDPIFLSLYVLEDGLEDAATPSALLGSAARTEGFMA
jgi:hypothetical protein